MHNHIGRVFKSGNSYAIRVPMAWIEAHQLQAGDRVQLSKSIRKVEDGAATDQHYVPPATSANDPMPEWD